MTVARHMPGAGVCKTPREETAGGLRGRASDAMGILASGGLSPRTVERWCGKRSRVGTRLGGPDRQNRRRQREIEPRDGYRGRCKVEPDHCRSRFGEAEMQA